MSDQNTTVVRLREIRDGLAQTFCDAHDLDVNPIHLPELLGYLAAAIVAVNNIFPEEEPA